MTAANCSVLGIALILVGLPTSAASANDPPGKMALLPGYKHEPLRGIDSIVGKISKPKGLVIQYEIGRVVKAGQPRLGGDFTDQAKAIAEAERQWYKEQTLGGQTIHLTLTKKDGLLVSYPDSGINFYVTVKTPEEVTEALLMILSYQGGK